MDIENQKHRGSRFFKNGRKKREVFEIDEESGSGNQIKLFGEEHDSNSPTPPASLLAQSPTLPLSKETPKHIEDKVSGSSSKFVKNEIYYGQFNEDKLKDYGRVQIMKQQQEEPAQQAGGLQEIEEVREVKKQRKLTRKNRSSINKFLEIVLDQKIDPIKETINGSEQDNHGRLGDEKIETQGEEEHIVTSNQDNSQSAEKGSSYSPNNVLRLESFVPKEKKLEGEGERERDSEDQEGETGIGSFSALLGINNSSVSLKPMMYAPLPVNSLMKCYIKRASSFNLTLLFYLDDHKFLMKSQSQNASIGCNHYLSLSTDVNKNSEAYLGKLRSDFVGSVYTLYDYGASEKEKKDIKCKAEARRVLANIQYQNNILGIKGPRRIKVRVPNPKVKDQSIFKLKDKQTLASLKSSEDILNPPVLTLQNKKPVWNQKISTYALNFGGRVKMPSIKNFILQNSNQETVMTFGKVDSNTFTLQFRHPLSPFQAFGIAMSSFDFKLSCE